MVKKLSEKQQIEYLLKRETLFQGLDHSLLEEFAHSLKIITLTAHKPISEKNKELIDNNLVIVAKGLIIATRGKEEELSPPESKAYGHGDIINIMSVLDLKFPVHISSVEEDSKLIVVNLDTLESKPEFLKIKEIIIGNITRYASERLNYIEQVLSNVNEVTMRTIQQRMEDSRIKLPSRNIRRQNYHYPLFIYAKLAGFTIDRASFGKYFRCHCFHHYCNSTFHL